MKLIDRQSGNVELKAPPLFLAPRLKHRRTGLEILGGRTQICPTRAKGTRTSKGVQGHAPQENFEK